MDVNKNRFTGFTKLYDRARPHPPQKVIDIVKTYLSEITCVVDLGSGTGLSTELWTSLTNNVIGVEPTDDMRNEAQKKYQEIRFITANSYETTLDSHSADVVTCSQAFHWMEPFRTITEVSRILKENGIFVVYDCIWPVQWNWRAEKAYDELFSKVNQRNTTKRIQQYSKDTHLENFRKSGLFRYSRQILFDNVEPCDSERFINLALSQGAIQDLLKQGNSEIAEEIDKFKTICFSIDRKEMRISYMMCIGIK